MLKQQNERFKYFEIIEVFQAESFARFGELESKKKVNDLSFPLEWFACGHKNFFKFLKSKILFLKNNFKNINNFSKLF